MPPGDNVDVIDRAIRTDAIVARNDGSLDFGGSLSPRTARYLERAGLSDRVKDALREPSDELWTELVRADVGTRRAADLSESELVFASAVFQRIAKQQIEERWSRDGGPRSGVGLPVGKAIEVHPTTNGFEARFRSGQMLYTKHGHIEIKLEQWVQLLFVGLECVSRQETPSDQIYGVVACFPPAMGGGTAKSHRFPGGNATISMGRSPGERLMPTHVELYKGPISDLVIVCSLVENDSGKVEQISAKIAEKIAEVTAALVGGLTGVPAESVTEESWFQDGLKFGVGFVLDDVFGMGDDPYPALNFEIPHDADRRPIQSRTRPDDPKVIPQWTHETTLSASDDGGDLGVYKLYFLLRDAPALPGWR